MTNRFVAYPRYPGTVKIIRAPNLEAFYSDSEDAREQRNTSELYRCNTGSEHCLTECD